MFRAFEKIRRRQLSIGDAVASVLPKTVRSELATRFTGDDGRLEMESMIEGHWKRVLPDQPLTMERFRSAWGCALAGTRLADLVARSCEAGRVPLLLADGRFLGLDAASSITDVDEDLVGVISEGVALPERPSLALWQAFRSVLASRTTAMPGVEVIGAYYAGCVRLVSASTTW